MSKGITKASASLAAGNNTLEQTFGLVTARNGDSKRAGKSGEW